MTIADLIDLEAQLARDREADASALEARDRPLLAGEAIPGLRRGDLIGRWLDALRGREPRPLFPGHAVATAIRGLRAALVLAGVFLGWGAATAVLQYTGGHPVNVWDFLLVFVGIQVLLVLLLLASLLLPMASLGAPLFGLFRGLFAAFYPRLAARGLGAGPRVDEWRLLWHRLRSRRSLYHRVEPWILVGLAQGFGVAFNVGALAALLRLVAFSDLAFSWSTTLAQLDAGRFHALVRSLALPFGWAWADAVPTRALVEATRYSRLEGAYLLSGAGRAAHPELLGAWWPFLAGALACYGLLPRLAMLAVARLRVAALLAGLPLDDVEVARLADRLAAPRVETSGAAPEAPAPSWPRPVPSAAGEPAGERCALVLWRDVPRWPELEEAVGRQAGRPARGVHEAGGRDCDEEGRDWKGALDGADPVLLVAEGWEAPDRSVLRLLAELRRALGPTRRLGVLLVEEGGGAPRPAPAGQVRMWRDSLARLEDPYLAVEPLRGGTVTGSASGVPRFAVVGRVNKGKSSIVATLAEDDSVRIDPRPGTTTEVREYPVRVDGRTLFVLLDTPGFEDAPRALAWMRARGGSAADRAARVAEFVAAHRGSADFADEQRLLAPILDGASVLYVVDGTRPFRPNYEAEMEILRWTGRPGMALVNRIGEGDHAAEWRRALDQYFRIVRDLDAFSASFEERLRILEAFRELRPEWRAPLDEAATALVAQRRRRRAEAAAAIAELLVDELTHTEEIAVADEGALQAERDRLERSFHDALRAREERARRRVEGLYGHTEARFEEAGLERPVFQQDLFAEETWKVLGLSPAQMVAAGTVAGAAVGGTIDAFVGGASFLTGTVLGGAVGGATALYGVGRRFARIRRVSGAVGLLASARRYWAGAPRFRIGPHAQPNFPWVLLDRALLHYDAVARRTHARRGSIPLREEGARAGVVADLASAERRELEELFRALRKAPDDPPREVCGGIERSVARILARLDPVPGE